MVWGTSLVSPAMQSPPISLPHCFACILHSWSGDASFSLCRSPSITQSSAPMFHNFFLKLWWIFICCIGWNKISRLCSTSSVCQQATCHDVKVKDRKGLLGWWHREMHVLVDKLELQEDSRGALLAWVCHPCSALVMSLGRSSPGTSDAAGHCEKGVWEQGADSLALSCVSSVSGCCGTKCFVWELRLLWEGRPGHLHMGLIKSSSQQDLEKLQASLFALLSSTGRQGVWTLLVMFLQCCLIVAIALRKLLKEKGAGGGREKGSSARQLCCSPPHAELCCRSGSMPMQMKSYKANAAPLDVSHVKLRYEFPCWGGGNSLSILL